MITDEPPTDPWGSGPPPPHRAGPRARPGRPRAILHWSVLDENQVLLAVVGLVGVGVLVLGILALLPSSDGCRDQSCAIGAPIGVSWLEAENTVAAQFLPCGDETVSDVIITESRTGDVLWHLAGQDQDGRTTFIAGQVPEPYEEIVPFERLPVGRLELTMVGDATYVLGFERSDLFGDFVFINGDRVERSAFAAEARKVGGCAERAAPVGSDRSVMLTVGLVVLAGAAAVLLAVRFIDVGSGKDG